MVTLPRMSTPEQELAPRRRRRRVSKADPERAVPIATRVSLADRALLEDIAYRQRVTTADLLRTALEPLLASARADEKEERAAA